MVNMGRIKSDNPGRGIMATTASKVLFASARPEKLDRDRTLPAKFSRLLALLPIQERVAGKTVAIKMHLGGGIGYSTIHPLFVKLLVDHIKAGNPKRVFVTDGSITGASDRGYAKETIGAELVPALGADGKDLVRLETGWPSLPVAWLGRPIVEADVLIDFSHIKGHGACGFGGACKNLAMGCTPGETRGAMHGLEGELVWDKSKCTHCNKCLEECSTQANTFNEQGDYNIFWHHCRRCMHCMLACPTKAIRIQAPQFNLFQEGLARVAKLVLDTFKPEDVFFINTLMHITIYCDCWGFTTPALVPDIGIAAGQDIVAVEQACLDMIKSEEVIPGSITPPYMLRDGKHLFEKLHGKDPYVQVQWLEKLGLGTTRYDMADVK